MTTEWSPEAFRDHADDFALFLEEFITAGKCPRCWADQSRPPEIVAGSRATNCRCVPICRRCEVHESLMDLAEAPHHIDAWPWSKRDMDFVDALLDEHKIKQIVTLVFDNLPWYIRASDDHSLETADGFPHEDAPLGVYRRVG